MKLRPLLLSLTLLAAVAFAPSAHAQNVSVNALYSATDNGKHDFTTPALAPDGNLYWSSFYGEVYQMPPTGEATLIHQFSYGVDGQAPSGLTLGSDGILYGTVLRGSGGSTGVFQIGTDGSVTMVYTVSDDYQPDGFALVAGADGNLYGMMTGNAFSEPSPHVALPYLFKVAPGGATSIVHTFQQSEINSLGYGFHMVLGRDGNVYGMILPSGYKVQAGDVNAGACFRIAAGGEYQLLHVFSGGGSDGAASGDGLTPVPLSDGFLFKGVESDAYPRGTEAKIGFDGTVTILKAYPADYSGDGGFPPATLGSDGFLYSADRDTNNNLAIYRVGMDDLDDSVLQSSAAVSGYFAYTRSPMLAANGGSVLYGATSNAIFRVTLSTPVKPVVTATAVDTSVNENGGGKARVVIKRTGDDLSSALTVRVVLRGTAVNGTDYQTVPNTVTIPAGSAKAKVKILPIDLGISGGSKTVVVKLKPATDGSYTLGDPFKATVTLIDND